MNLFRLFGYYFPHKRRSKNKDNFHTGIIFFLFFSFFSTSPINIGLLILVFLTKEIKLQTNPSVEMFEIFQAGLKAQVLPQQEVSTYQEFVAGIFGHQSPLREKRRTVGDASHYAAPFGIVSPEEMAVGYRQA